MRKVLNVLQSTWMAFKDVTEVNVYTCVGHPQKEDIKNIMNWLLNVESFEETVRGEDYAFKWFFLGMTYFVNFAEIKNLKTQKGLALQDIITEVHGFVHRMELPPRVLCMILIRLAEIEERLAAGCNENPQLSSLVSIFHTARDLVTIEN